MIHLKILTSTELRCPLKKIPNSDRADGITAKVNDKVSVKCDATTEQFALVCIAIRPGVAMWHGSASCPGVARLDDALPAIACCDARHDKHAQFSSITAVTCAPLDVDNGKASSTSPSKVTETVEITCDDGYNKTGTSAVCSSAGSGRVAWTNIPTCEGRLQACFLKARMNSKLMSQLGCLILDHPSHFFAIVNFNPHVCNCSFHSGVLPAQKDTKQ